MKRTHDQCCGNCIYYRDAKPTVLHTGICVWGQTHLPSCQQEQMRIDTHNTYGTACPCWQRVEG